MPLADHLGKAASAGCKVGAVLIDLDETDAAALISALADTAGYSSRRISAALTAYGYTVGRSTIQDHRAGVCRCEPR